MSDRYTTLDVIVGHLRSATRKHAGWWKQEPSGASFAESGDLIWGDQPADIIDDVVARGEDPFSPEVRAAVNEKFQQYWMRDCTDAEFEAGLRFSQVLPRLHGSKTASASEIFWNNYNLLCRAERDFNAAADGCMDAGADQPTERVLLAAATKIGDAVIAVKRFGEDMYGAQPL